MRVGIVILIIPVIASCGGRDLPEAAADRILYRACEYLWDAQAEDGGWHSQTHGLMRGGEATTAFVLNALLNGGDNCPFDESAKERALDFLRARVSENGALGLSDPDVVDYPNYSTSYALIVFALHGDESDSRLVAGMRDYLVSQQFDERRGIDFAHPAYGGWGFGETGLAAGSVGHVDLSHTRKVLEAIRLAGHANADTYNQARSFLRLHQRDPGDQRVREAGEAGGSYDGGFFASAALPVVNKSTLLGTSGETFFFSSYATATADGVLALFAAGADSEDENIRDARRWLSLFPDFAYPAGIPRDHPSAWGRIMFFYHVMARAEAYRKLGEPGSWRDDLALLLQDRQQPNGRFRNPYGAPNKEDDPLLATAMVVVALSQPIPPG